MLSASAYFIRLINEDNSCRVGLCLDACLSKMLKDGIQKVWVFKTWDKNTHEHTHTQPVSKPQSYYIALYS